MQLFRRFCVALTCVCMPIAHARAAAPLLGQVQVVADATAAISPIPAARTFTIATAGSYMVTLTDLQLPSALASLSLAVATPTTNALVLTAPGSKAVTLAPGAYTAQVLASAAQGAIGGAFGVQITPAAGGAAVLQFEDGVGAALPPPSTGQSVLSSKFSVSDAGTYQLSVSDLAFPVALSSLEVLVLNECGLVVGCVSAPVAPTPVMGPNSSVSLSLVPGDYDLYVLAAADPGTLQGLYDIQISGGPSGATLYATTSQVGELPPPILIPVATAGTVSLNLADLALPQALTAITGVVAEDGSVLKQLSGASKVTFVASTGTLQLFVLARPAAGGQGAYEAYLTSGGAVLADVAEPVLASGQYGYAYRATLPSAGGYELSVSDFQLPAAFNSLNAAVAQAGAVLSTTQGGTTSFTGAAGPINVVVLPALPSSSANGLFELNVAAQNTGVSAFESTQAVGALFSTQSAAITTAGSYDVTLTDLGFPENFSDLVVVVTSGATNVGEVIGAGRLTFTATPGRYVFNVLAQVGSGVDFGLYGLQVDSTPPAPLVTLTASVTRVTSGSGVTLTWNSSDAESCIASASPASTVWTGTLPATSGHESSGPLTATTTFSISCIGKNGVTGTTTASVTVTQPSSHSGGGGGAEGPEELLVLALLLSLRFRRLARSAGSRCPAGSWRS